MVRWEPGAAERLSEAALELFASQGFEATTTAQIAARAGLTERTFFRHFDDKREVLFSGQDLFVQGFLDAVDAAPANVASAELVTRALDGSAPFFADRRTHSRRRQRVIVSHRGLEERELHKLAVLAERLAAAMAERGISATEATLAAELCVTAFRISFHRWLAPGETRDLADLEHETLAGLKELLSGPVAAFP